MPSDVRTQEYPLDTVRAVRPIRIGLLGLGQVGSAVAALAAGDERRRFAVTAALVRTTAARRARVPLVSDPTALFATGPDVVVEALGGLEPARTVVLEAIARGIPVVTANKSLLARHGDELLEAAASADVPLCCESAVIAGVPFLAPVARRPMLAESLTSLVGIVNGTSNFVLSTIAGGGTSFAAALHEAQRRGLAEPDASMDVDGIDALEKLVVLLRQFLPASIDPGAIEVEGISGVTAADLRAAQQLGGCLKPIVSAAWDGDIVEAFAGPTFVDNDHLLSRLDGVTNGIVLRDRHGRDRFFAGPGAGPDVTATTVLDDVVEAVEMKARGSRPWLRRGVCAPQTGWLVALSHTSVLPEAARIADLFAGLGVSFERSSSDSQPIDKRELSFMTHACSRQRVQAVAAAFRTWCGGRASVFRAIGRPR